MALAKTYLSVDGRIMSEHRSGEANSRDYMHDPSGNVVGVYQNDYLVADAAYDPYGDILDSWNMTSYKFTFAGAWGYRQTGLAFSSVYVRARHYSPLDGGWTTRDPLWPSEMPYGYVDGRVPGSVDPSGMHPCLIPCAPCAACLIDLMIVCPPNDPMGWSNCVQAVWNELPPWLQFACGLACEGCISCVARGVKGKLLPKKQPCQSPTSTPPRRADPGRLRRGGTGKKAKKQTKDPKNQQLREEPKNKKQKGCPPCPPVRPEIDRVPPQEPHFPCPGDHVHWIVQDQNPKTCKCYPKRVFGFCIDQGSDYPPILP